MRNKQYLIAIEGFSVRFFDAKVKAAVYTPWARCCKVDKCKQKYGPDFNFGLERSIREIITCRLAAAEEYRGNKTSL